MTTDWRAIEAILQSASLVIDNQSGHLFRRVDDGLWICSCGVYLKRVNNDLGFMRRYSTDGKTWKRENPPCQSAECQLVGLGVAIYRGRSPAPGVCPVCELEKPDVATRRLNTMYAEDESNWMMSCGECHAERVEYYRGLWDEYYNGLGI